MRSDRASPAALAVCIALVSVFCSPGPRAGYAAETISAAEYFFDQDPGPGNGTPLPPKDGAFDSAEEEVDLELPALTGRVGPHTLYVRFRSSSGVWGIARPLPNDLQLAAPFNFRLTGVKYLAAAEYFLDSDPGEGNGIPLPAADGAFDEAEEEIDVPDIDPSALVPGAHELFVRFKDSEGVWGPARRVAFQGRGLGACEYFIDTDPGEGSGSPLPPTDGFFDSGVESVELADVDTSGLAEGPHTLFARCRDARGYWGVPQGFDFYMDYTAPAVHITSPPGCTLDPTPLLSCTITDARPTTEVVKVDGALVDEKCGDELGPLAEGSHTVTVESTDAAGNQGSDTRRFNVGPVAPVVTLTSPLGCTNDSTPLLEYSLGDPTAVVAVKLDGAVVNKTSGDSLDPLGDGQHTLVVEATNACGRFGSVSATFRVDTVQPLVSISQPADGSFTKDDTPLLGCTVADATATVLAVKVDGAVVSKKCGDPLDALVEGHHTVLVEATDACGNQGSSPLSGFTVDATAPVVAISAPADGSLTGDPTPLLAFGVNEVNPGTTVVKVDGAVVSKGSGDSLDALADGPHTVTVEHTDKAGNTANASSGFAVDTKAPAVTVTAPADGSVTNDPTPLLAFAVDEANPDATVVKVDGVVVNKVSGDSLDALADGQHTVLVESTDRVGLKGSATSTFTVDRVAPTVVITAPPKGSVIADATPLLAFSSDDPAAVVVVKVDGVVVSKTSGQSLDPLAEGTHTVLVEATDRAGNQGSDSAAFTLDTTPPTVTITSPRSGWWYRALAPPLVFTVSEGTPRVTLDGAAVNLRSGESVGPLAAGVHRVRVEATDAAGLTGAGECTFQILFTHRGDWDGDYRISLAELLQLIQFFNSGSYHCDPAGDGGYAAGPGSQDCPTHDADYQDPRWSISLSELLRLIQLYNSGGFHLDPDGEDGFAPGL